MSIGYEEGPVKSITWQTGRRKRKSTGGRSPVPFFQDLSPLRNSGEF